MTLTPNESNPPKALAEILDVNLSECEITVCLASVGKRGDFPEFQKIQLSDDLSDEFRGVAAQTLSRLRTDLTAQELVLQSYDPSASLEPHEVEYFELSNDGSVKQQIDSLESLATLNVFAVEAEFVQGLRFYVIVAEPKKGKPIYFFRSYTPKKELQRSSLFGAVLKKGHFDKVSEPLFLFDHFIDCINGGEYMFIFSKDKFQKIFQFFERLLATAQITLDDIKLQVPISNFDEFERSCQGHVQKLAKLNSISQKPYFKSLSMRQMKKVIKEFNLGIKTTKINGEEALVFDTSDKWGILHLLDDYYLGSPMTGLKYGANSKRLWK
jgi:hypothetical protein